MIGRNRDVNPQDYLRITEKQKQLQFLVKLACLAPSSHNIQPWLFRLDENTQTITMVFDKKRKLKQSDPTDREAYLSLGAAAGNLAIASKAYGFVFSEDFSSSPAEWVYKISYTSLAVHNPDFDTLRALVKRHSNRFDFEEKKVSEDFYVKIKDIAGERVKIDIFDDAESMSELKQVVEDSVEAAFKDKNFTSELADWVRPSLPHYEDGMPGYYMAIPWPMSFIVPILIRYANLSKMQKDMHAKMLGHAPAYAVLSVKSDDPRSWVIAGYLYEKIAVQAQKDDVRLGLFGAPIEIGEYYKKLQKFTGTDVRPVMFMRMGYTDKTPNFSPRLSINKVITNGI